MMRSNILSRLLPPTGPPSVYETIRQHDADSDTSDAEERAGMELGEHLSTDFGDQELEDVLAGDRISGSTSPDPEFFQAKRQSRPPGDVRPEDLTYERNLHRPRWMRPSSPEHEADEGDGDVPQSLLVEGRKDDHNQKQHLRQRPSFHDRFSTRAPALESLPDENRTYRRNTQARRPPPNSVRVHALAKRWLFRQNPNMAAVDPREKAMWRWANVENLDNFIGDVYTYFLGNGIWSILLTRALNLLTFAFVVGFSTFLMNCVSYRSIRGSKTLDDILIQKCTAKMSASFTFLLWLFTFFWIGKVFQYLLDIMRLKHMHDFYLYLLNITDPEVQTISWQEVVSRLMALRDANPATAGAISSEHRKFIGSQSKQRMDAHDIANRLMRKENYLIAMVNKEILDLTLPLPLLRNRQLFSRTLEWNINLCVMDYVFNEQGQVRTLFLRDTHRRALSEGLRRRFIFAGIMNIFVAPLIVLYFLMHYFFRYFNEYKRNPAQIGSRQYTPLAEWKFREFNELWHLFERRVNMSYPFAARYIDQFPKDKTVQLARFVAFISGALASVLALVSLVDPELFLVFEITPDRTVLFYLGVLGSIWAFARGLVPEESDVFEPEFALLELINFTHYFPGQWKGRLHSDEVRKDFANLYQMKIVIFLEEILSMIFTPFVLWFSLPKCSDRLIDFFREFTVHVDGMGYLCSFAVFDFKKGTSVMQQGDRQDRSHADPRAEYFSTKDGKMLASYYGFLDNYGASNRPAHPVGKRNFHPPPTFPTLGSPSGFESGPVADKHEPLQTQYRRGSHSNMRRSRFDATDFGDHASLAPSMLLDPHHQPSVSSFRTTNRVPYPRHSASRPFPISDTIEDSGEPPVEEKQHSRAKQAEQVAQAATASIGGAGTSESNLADSWRVNLTGNENSGRADECEDVDAITGGAGVLGLIQQFQKANSGRGPSAASL